MFVIFTHKHYVIQARYVYAVRIWHAFAVRSICLAVNVQEIFAPDWKLKTIFSRSHSHYTALYKDIGAAFGNA
jgi:hypothetical protein